LGLNPESPRVLKASEERQGEGKRESGDSQVGPDTPVARGQEKQPEGNKGKRAGRFWLTTPLQKSKGGKKRRSVKKGNWGRHLYTEGTQGVSN